MVLADDKTPKGLATILQERGNDINPYTERPLCKKCKYCKDLLTRNENILKDIGKPRLCGLTVENVHTYPCCMQYTLSMEPDFLEQDPWLIEETKKLGFVCKFFPKYHCELNFIEQIWGWLKSYHRRNCTYKYADLKRELPITMIQRLPISFVRRASRKCDRTCLDTRTASLASFWSIRWKHTSHIEKSLNVLLLS